MESGEEIADKALELGFGELELGFHTTLQQVKGFKVRLDKIPVGSVHAFCPVPISAPQGYPELYQLASFDEETRKMARLQVARNIRFAAEMGADTVVLHMGRVMCRGWFSRWDMKRRHKRGVKMLDVARRELEALVPELEKNNVTLALENLPYLEGFPNESELLSLLAKGLQHAPVKGWFDTGHDRVRELNGWRGEMKIFKPDVFAREFFAGMHINDVVSEDDHLAPGMGKVDFAALKDFAGNVRHVVFEPHAGITEDELKAGLAHLRNLWNTNDPA